MTLTDLQHEPITTRKVRVKKAPAVRRGELVDCAQRLFFSQGYEKTTINDVISATSLSKGAFYHHFRSKEDLLEAISARFAAESSAVVAELNAHPGLNALQRLNLLLALGRDWKLENIGGLRAMLATLLKPENAVLYHRIVEAGTGVLAPALAEILRQGQEEGVLNAGDPEVTAQTILWLSYARRSVIVEALAVAEADIAAAAEMILRRLRAEEGIIDRILGLPPGSVQMHGPGDYVREVLEAWVHAGT